MNKNECSEAKRTETNENGGNKMLAILLKTSAEFILCALLIYGFIHEKQVIKFEQRLKRIIVANYRKYRNKKNLHGVQHGKKFRLINGRKNIRSGAYRNGFDVA